MQIDQDPGNYRVRRPDGSWTQRSDKVLCRWMGIFCITLALMIALASPDALYGLAAAMFGLFAGGLIILSMRSSGW